MAARWAADHHDAILSADPEVPEALSDRAADIWTPLLAIADLAGGEWPARARHAALALSADGVVEDESLGAMLLFDLQGFLRGRTDSAFSTRTIIDHLVTLEERPWPSYGKARKAINAKQLADILKPFEVRSSTIRIGDSTPKGYRREDIERAAERYLTVSAATTPQPAENRQKSVNSPATSAPFVAGEKTPKPAASLGCGVVAAENPEPGAEQGIGPWRERI
jgi:putative DNA primase/helicase